MIFVVLGVVALFAFVIAGLVTANKSKKPACKSKYVHVAAFYSREAAEKAAAQASRMVDFADGQPTLTVMCASKTPYLLAWVVPGTAWTAVKAAQVAIRYETGATDSKDVKSVSEVAPGVVLFEVKLSGSAWVKLVIDEVNGCHAESAESHVVLVGATATNVSVAADRTPNPNNVPPFSYQWNPNVSLLAAQIDPDVLVDQVTQVPFVPGQLLFPGEWDVIALDPAGSPAIGKVSVGSPGFPESPLASSWAFAPLEEDATYWDQEKKVMFALQARC